MRETTPAAGAPVSDDACRLLGVVKRYAGVTALDLDELRLRAGEVHALVGHNGSGKSTLIKTLAGYYEADNDAEARLDGEPEEILGNPHLSSIYFGERNQ